MSFMDAREHGSKIGGAGVASAQVRTASEPQSPDRSNQQRSNQCRLFPRPPDRAFPEPPPPALSTQHEAIDRRERLRRLALETIDLAKDPYFMRNHLGRYDPDPATLPKPPTTHAFRVETRAPFDTARGLTSSPDRVPSIPRLISYECKLCLTIHGNEGSYLAHTQGKRHQQNLAKRAAREAAEESTAARR